jgi:urease accessory protein
MTTDVLTLSQLLSPSFPVGAFAYSNGLETAIEDGTITTAQTLADWLTALLTHGGARADAVLLNAAYQADTHDVQTIDVSARAFAASKERLMETDLQGAAFCDTVRAVFDISLDRLTYPVAVGRTAKTLGLDPTLTTAMYLQAFVGNMSAAAMRLVPLGQTDGQRVQRLLKPLCLSVAADVQNATLDDLHASAFMSDIAAMRHETKYSRVFRT